ncbi:MAG: pentapeptide repeat-containing protein [Humidesulfovibrio sp.]
MVCCKCEEHQWDDRPIDCTTYDGVGYCIFHNPHNKGISSESYSKLVTERILSTGKSNASVNLSGAIFPWDFMFGSHFESQVDYVVDLKHAVFRGDADFHDARLNISDFTGVKFEKKAIFKCAKFLDSVSFVEAEFIGTTTFESSAFFHDAMFDNSTFFEKSNFNDVKFLGEANFGEATFHKRCMFRKSIFRRNTSFMFTVFLSESLFTSASFFGETNFITTEFGANTYFFDNNFSGVTIFTGSNISKKMYIGSPRKVSGTISLTGLSAGPDSIRIKEFNSEMMFKLFFIDVDIEYLCFLSCILPDAFRVSGDNKENVKMLESIYRRLKQKSCTEHDQRMVSEWHYREKLMAMKRGENSVFEATLLRLYYTSSSFCERPMRAGCCLAGLVALPLLLFGVAKLATTGLSLRPDVAAIADVFMDWQRALPLSKVPAEPLPTAWKLWMFYISQLLIALQAALFGFAVRNRFRR